MTWIQRLIDKVAGGGDRKLLPSHAFTVARVHARRTITTTISFGIELRNAQLEIIEHSALTAMLCRELAQRLPIPEGDAYILRTAAELHEVGMLAISPDLLLRPTPLTPEELERVRRQAKVSAKIAATMHHPRVPLLIEHQYDDFAVLSETLSREDLLLAGVLRVADTIAAVTRPRPYQDRMPVDERARMLERGAGSRFHPQVIEGAVALAESIDDPLQHVS